MPLPSASCSTVRFLPDKPLNPTKVMPPVCAFEPSTTLAADSVAASLFERTTPAPLAWPKYMLVPFDAGRMLTVPALPADDAPTRLMSSAT